MLERVTACLKSGAVRDSLKCAQQVSRSKRMLHSTFWSHGAGDLDLPPWVLSTLPMPRDLPLKSDDPSWRWRRSKRSQQTECLRNRNAAVDIPFLDFLYPPQALVWLQRANSQQWQRWERRNARRLPEGFVVASRGYASKSEVQNLFTDAVASTEGEQLEDYVTTISGADVENRQRDDIGAFQSSDSVTRDRAGQDEDLDKRPNERRVGKDSMQAPDLHWRGELPQSSAFADSPADLDYLAEESSGQASADTPSDDAHGPGAIQRLRKLMSLSRSGQSKDTEEVTMKAVRIYDTLDNEATNDVRLRRELLEWLSLQDNEAARSRCIELYKSISINQRTLQTYQAALSVHFERGEPASVIKLHKEALQNLENGYQISRTLFRHAVMNHSWALAIQVERAHRERYLGRPTNDSHGNTTSQLRVFWLHVSEIPRLLVKAVDLAKFLRSRKDLQLLDDHTHEFAATFFKEAISQEFSPTDVAHSFKGSSQNFTFPRRHIRRLIAHISRIEKDAPKFFHALLVEMLRADSGYNYSQLHHVASFVHTKYRTFPDVRLSEELFMRWLECLTEYSDRLSRVGSSSRSLSIADLISHWKQDYGKISKQAVSRLLTFYARSGQLEPYEHWLEYLRSIYPDYKDQKDVLWTMVWIHARRADLGAAQRAFAEVKRTTSEHGEEPDITCWNLLLLAHSRADDPEGALTNLQNMIDYSKLIPDKYSFQNVLQMLAKRGDVGGTQDLLEQYDRIAGRRRETAHLGSLLLAHINNDDVQTAEDVLRQAIPKVRDGEIGGSLTGCFNMIMTACAMRRDIDATRRTYRWMKEEGVALDANSYAAIIQALAFYRQTQQAYGILTKVMPANGIEPTAFHYGILIAGFVNNRQHQKAIEVYQRMVQLRIKPSVAAHSAYLKARAIAEHRSIGRWRTPESEPAALTSTMKELKRLLQITDGAEIALKQPQLGFGRGTLNLNEVPASYFDFLIFIHGQRHCFEAVKALYQQYKEDNKKRGQDQDTTPIRLLASFASASWRYGNHEDVEQCWKMAKEQADQTAPVVAVPQLKLPSSKKQLDNDVHEVEPPTSGSNFESGFDAEQRSESDIADTPGEPKQTLLMDKQSPRPRPPSPGRRHILSRVLNYYLLSLHSVGRTSDAIRTVKEVINQGYTMENRTWNTFLESLCRNSPPLALLAFVLAERFLTPHFPGWSPTVEYPPTREAVYQGLQYIKARYLAPGQLMPKYRTLVWMSAALIELRKLLAQGRAMRSFNLPPELKRYVGTIKQIRRHAPKTLLVVQSLPKVPDRLQSRLLHRESS